MPGILTEYIHKRNPGDVWFGVRWGAIAALAIIVLAWSFWPSPKFKIVPTSPAAARHNPKAVIQTASIKVHGSVSPGLPQIPIVSSPVDDSPGEGKEIDHRTDSQANWLPPGEYPVSLSGDATATYAYPGGTAIDTQPISGTSMVIWDGQELSIEADLDATFAWTNEETKSAWIYDVGAGWGMDGFAAWGQARRRLIGDLSLCAEGIISGGGLTIFAGVSYRWVSD